MENPQEESCTKCQKPLLPEARFCGSCGTVVPIESEPEPETVPVATTTKASSNIALGCITILIMAGGLIWAGSAVVHYARNKVSSTMAKMNTATVAAPIAVTNEPQPQSGNVTIDANSGKISKEAAPVVAEPRVITEAYLLSITQKTLHECNRSGVKRAQWARIKSSKDGPVYEIHFAADDNFSHRAIRDMAALDAFSLLKGIRDVADLGPLERVIISATFSLADKNGNSSEDDIMTFEFNHSTLIQLNWDKIEVSDQVFKAADRVWISPVVSD